MTTSSSYVAIQKMVITVEPKTTAAPTFSVAGGDFSAAFDLTITGATGTTLKYTTDGTAPGSSTTAIATTGNTATVSIPAATTTVRAIAVKDGIVSEETTATYNYVDASKQTPTLTLPEEVTLTVGEEGKAITVTTNSDGAVTFTSSDEEKLYVSTDGSLYAIAAGTYTVIVNVASTDTYNSATGTVSVIVTKNETGLAYSVTEATAKVGKTFYAPTLTNPHSLDVSFASSQPAVATIDEEGVVTILAGGTTVISATYEEDDEYFGAVASYTLTVTDPNNLTALFDFASGDVFDEAGGNTFGDGSEATINRVTIKVSQGSSTSSLISVKDNGEYRVYKSSYFTISVPDGYALTKIVLGVGTKTGNNYKLSNITTDVKTYDSGTWTGAAQSVKFTASGAQTRLLTLEATYKKTAETVTLTTAGLATYVSDYALDYSTVTGLAAYKAKVAGNDITFTKVSTVPAGEGVLLRALTDLDETTSFTIPVATTTVADWADDDNDFIAGEGKAVQSKDGDTYNYILNVVGGVPGFYRAAGQTVATNRAYLSTTAEPVTGSRLSFAFVDGEATAISTVATSRHDTQTVYTLSGQRVTAPQHGLYIVNGRKVVVK